MVVKLGSHEAHYGFKSGNFTTESVRQENLSYGPITKGNKTKKNNANS